VLPYEYTLVTESGRKIESIITTKLIDYEGEKALLGVITDITQRLEAERRVELYSRQLEQMVATRTARIRELEKKRTETEKFAATGRMAARIAHEINNPLAGIKNACRLVKQIVPADHEHYPYLDRVDAEIERITKIIQQMTMIYRIQQKPSHEFSVNKTTEDVLKLIEGANQDQDISINARIELRDDIVKLPEDSYRQILYNMILNAIEASAPGDSIEVKVTGNKKQLDLTIADQGKGIAPEHKDQIFEPFFTTKEHLKKSGLGLGLPITKSLVDAMNGTIEFESTLGQGTTFNIKLSLDKSIREKTNGDTRQDSNRRR
jgi:signal transduction histidine kinase